MIDDDLIEGDGETGDGVESAPNGGAQQAGLETVNVEGVACISCGADTFGVFCPNCGQKNDDLRRSLFLLGRDFIEDTFAFDSRMWRTLGLLAVAPGVVPTNYAHGRRSKYTPPVRLFLVVSFLFFLILTLTQTLIAAIEVRQADESVVAGIILDKEDFEPSATVNVDIGDEGIDCEMGMSLEFFVKASSLNTNSETVDTCLASLRQAATEDIETSLRAENEEDAMTAEEAEEAVAMFDRVAAGASEAVKNPKAFNAAFNNWLPRIMFLMTPVLALVMGVFIRGKDALFFDHMVLSLYSHAVGFAVVGIAIVGGQLGVPMVGLIATIGLFVYFILTIKRAYKRGWIKTVYTSVMVSFIYMIILLVVVLTIATRIVIN